MIEDFENILLSDLKDIRGLDDVSMFPLALGWWLLIGVVILIILGLLLRKVKNFFYKRTWKHNIRKELNNINVKLTEDNIKESIAEITEILKRIAIDLYGRGEVAALHGDDWLEWLEIRNSSNFNWKKNRDLLVSVPYMQNYKIKVKEKEVRELIKAVQSFL